MKTGEGLAFEYASSNSGSFSKIDRLLKKL